jgi:hypothetical protein
MPLNCSIYHENVCIASLLFDSLKNCRIHDKFSVQKCVFYSSLQFCMKCFYAIKYFVNFAMDTQTRIFIQCHLIGAFTKLCKAPVGFVMSVYLSICSNEFCSQLKDFCEIILQIFTKNCQENSSLVKIRQIYQHFT